MGQLAVLRVDSGWFAAGNKVGHRNFHDILCFCRTSGTACTSTCYHSGGVCISGYQGFWGISMIFKDFMKSDGMNIVDTPSQSHQGSFSPRKRAFQKCFKTFEWHFSFLSAFCNRFRIVKMPRCRQHHQNVENHQISMIFIDFHWFSLMLLYLWILIVLKDHQKVRKSKIYNSDFPKHFRNVCFRGRKVVRWSGTI